MNNRLKQHQKIIKLFLKSKKEWLTIGELQKLQESTSDLFVGYEINTRVSDLTLDDQGNKKTRNKTEFVLHSRTKEGTRFKEYRLENSSDHYPDRKQTSLLPAPPPSQTNLFNFIIS